MTRRTHGCPQRLRSDPVDNRARGNSVGQFVGVSSYSCFMS
jgi:hypothetical protein